MSGKSRGEETVDEQRALAEIRRALSAELARRPAVETDDLPAGVGDPALCPRPLCRRTGACRAPGREPCLNDAAERMRLALCERLRQIRSANGKG